MRIWIIHQHAIPPIVMGPTRHFDLAKKLIEQGHEVFIFAGNYCHNNFHYIAEPYRKTKKISYYSNVPFIWFDVPEYKKNSLKRLWNMVVFGCKLFTSKDINYLPKPDIIIGSSPSPFAAFAAQRIAKRFKVPFVYEIRDLWPETLISLGNFSKFHPLIAILQRIENFLLAKANKIISVLPGIEKYLLTKKIPKEKNIWLPNAVDINQINYNPADKKEKITILYAGSFNISNNIETLLYAAKILQNQDPNKFQIKLMGDGPLKLKLQEIIENENIRNVEFLSTVSKKQIHTILATADICVGMVKKSNLYRWGTSLNKITDYLAAARPIVFALDSPYSPIKEANAGITVEPENPQMMADAFLTLSLKSQQELHQLGLNGRRYAEQFFNLDIVTTNLVNCLNSCSLDAMK